MILFIPSLLNKNHDILLYLYYSDIHQYQKWNVTVISYTYVCQLPKVFE